MLSLGILVSLCVAIVSSKPHIIVVIADGESRTLSPFNSSSVSEVTSFFLHFGVETQLSLLLISSVASFNRSWVGQCWYVCDSINCRFLFPSWMD